MVTDEQWMHAEGIDPIYAALEAWYKREQMLRRRRGAGFVAVDHTVAVVNAVLAWQAAPTQQHPRYPDGEPYCRHCGNSLPCEPHGIA